VLPLVGLYNKVTIKKNFHRTADYTAECHARSNDHSIVVVTISVAAVVVVIVVVIGRHDDTKGKKYDRM
jgi:hypothetical protein